VADVWRDVWRGASYCGGGSLSISGQRRRMATAAACGSSVAKAMLAHGVTSWRGNVARRE